MRRGLTYVGLALVVLAGGAMALDPRFLRYSEYLRNPAMAAYIFGPTVLFLLIAGLSLPKRVWPTVAFSLGLLFTGVFHQYVVSISDGNPGYMFPAGHIFAPFFGAAGYLVSFLVVWGVRRVISRPRTTREPPESGEDRP